MPYRHQVIRQPGDEQIPVVVEAKETEADTNKISIGQQPSNLLGSVSGCRSRPGAMT